MKSLKNLAGRLRRPLIMAGMVAGLAMGTATVANADAWDFSYSGGGISVSGQIYGSWNANGYWDITAITGTHNTDAITGLWCQTSFGSSTPGACVSGNNNYLAGVQFGSPTNYPDQLDLHFIAGSTDYAFGYLVGPPGNWGPPIASEGANSNLDWPGSGRCIPGDGCTEVQMGDIVRVPEINASAGLGALGALFGFFMIMREMFSRRRGGTGMLA